MASIFGAVMSIGLTMIKGMLHTHIHVGMKQALACHLSPPILILTLLDHIHFSQSRSALCRDKSRGQSIRFLVVHVFHSAMSVGFIRAQREREREREEYCIRQIQQNHPRKSAMYKQSKRQCQVGMHLGHSSQPRV
jgi:hypothetical protein